MKITRLYVYPIKALRGIELQTADLGAQGIRHDRRFMLFRVRPDGELKKMQLSEVPECALFEQQIVDNDESILVRFHRPADSPRPADQVPQSPLTVPLNPDATAGLRTLDISLHGSPARVYRMPDEFSSWFAACFGYDVVLVYIGDGKRPVLGSTLLPHSTQKQQQQQQQQQRGWLSGITSFLTGTSQEDDKHWLTFTDVAPLLVTTEASLRNVQARMSSDSPEDDDEEKAVDMYKFRPNIVVDGEDDGDAWAEDFWAELTVNGGRLEQQQQQQQQHRRRRLLLTGNCLRCTSLNVDYETGRPAAGDAGTVLKKLMRDRRVDEGNRWSPVFGRYAFLADDGGFAVSVGDEVEVTGRLRERTTWDWPGL